eukprot:SAG31_NODE_8418_length_1455_cov_2.064159_1_plen_34_part_10
MAADADAMIEQNVTILGSRRGRGSGRPARGGACH